MAKVGPSHWLEPDRTGRTDGFEMISITVSDSSPRTRALMLLQTDKPSRVTLMAVGTNQNRFTASPPWSLKPQPQTSALLKLRVRNRKVMNGREAGGRCSEREEII